MYAFKSIRVTALLSKHKMHLLIQRTFLWQAVLFRIHQGLGSKGRGLSCCVSWQNWHEDSRPVINLMNAMLQVPRTHKSWRMETSACCKFFHRQNRPTCRSLPQKPKKVRDGLATGTKIQQNFRASIPVLPASCPLWNTAACKHGRLQASNGLLLQLPSEALHWE